MCGESYLRLGDKSDATIFEIVNGTTIVRGTNPPVSIALYPYGTKVDVAQDGTSTATAPNGTVLAPNGPGNLRTVLLGTGPGTVG